MLKPCCPPAGNSACVGAWLSSGSAQDRRESATAAAMLGLRAPSGDGVVSGERVDTAATAGSCCCGGGCGCPASCSCSSRIACSTVLSRCRTSSWTPPADAWRKKAAMWKGMRDQCYGIVTICLGGRSGGGHARSTRWVNKCCDAVSIQTNTPAPLGQRQPSRPPHQRGAGPRHQPGCWRQSVLRRLPVRPSGSGRGRESARC